MSNLAFISHIKGLGHPTRIPVGNFSSMGWKLIMLMSFIFPFAVFAQGINSFPYQEDFENGKGGWNDSIITTPLSNAAGFELGTPNKTNISNCASGDSCWISGGLTSAYGPRGHYFVESPLFDFTNLNNPYISLKINYDIESPWDGACMIASADSGTTWIRIGTLGTGINWINYSGMVGGPGSPPLTTNDQGWSGSYLGNKGSNGWLRAQHDLKPLANASDVLLRIVFKSDLVQGFDGFAFDDITIIEGLTIDLGPDTTLCLGEDITLDLGFYANASYFWSNGPNGQTQSLLNAGQGPGFNLTGCVTDSLGFYYCDEILVRFSPISNPAIPSTILCPGDSIRLDGKNSTVNTHVWYAYDSSSSSFIVVKNNRFLSTDTSGIYVLQVSDPFGCLVQDTVEVLIDDVPTINLPPDDTVCVGTSIILNAPSGPPGTLYDWRLNGNLFANTQTLFASSPGRYDVLLTTSAGCTTRDSFLLDVKLAPVVNLGKDQIQCYPITLDGLNPGSTYIWNTGDTSRRLTVQPPFRGWVEVTNPFGCVAADTIDIQLGDPPIVDLGPDQVVCNASSIILDAGQHPSNTTIRWSTGSFGRNLLVRDPGLYISTVTDSNACITIDSIEIFISKLDIDLGPDTVICDGKSIVLDASYPGSTYQWNTNHRGPQIIVNAEGTYSVTVTDALGCLDYDSIFVAKLPAYEGDFTLSPTWTVALGQAIQFTSSQVPGTQTWNWEFGDGNKASGASVNHTYASLDTFEVCLQIFDGQCRDTVCREAGTYLVFQNLEDEMGIQLDVFPNPSNGPLQVHLSLKNPSFVSLALLDLKGIVLFQEKWSERFDLSHTIHAKDLPQGLYLLEIGTSLGKTYRKVIIR